MKDEVLAACKAKIIQPGANPDDNRESPWVDGQRQKSSAR